MLIQDKIHTILKNKMDEGELNQRIIEANLAGATQENASRSAQYFLQEQEKGLADSQLEVDNIKSEIYHLLRQDKLKETATGKIDWIPLEDKKERTLSDWGVDRLIQVINFYINKNNLLSNFDSIQINRLMLKFIREINDLVLLKYQVLFSELTFEECKEIMLKNIETKTKMKMFTNEIMGLQGDEKKIEKELFEEIELKIEKEMDKIKTENRKEKIRDYGLIIAQLEVIVFATLNRAYRGEERGSLRRHMNVTEMIGSKVQVPQIKEGGFMGWGKR